MTHSTDELPDHARLVGVSLFVSARDHHSPIQGDDFFCLFRRDGSSCGNTIQRRLCYRVVKDTYVNATAHEADG